ncbi:unnamed protein product [Ambrosiozyma monospora]|uniref:Unnamed protein product n=1 Tax=Ambrosiozyma monospora TaxID=43982 RepID=A0A9W6YLF4_AMBMO|nr:unnamed protein product [Ambrosiozyma monospora]
MILEYIKEIHVRNGHASAGAMRGITKGKVSWNKLKKAVAGCFACNALVNKVHGTSAPYEDSTKKYRVGEKLVVDIIGPYDGKYVLIMKDLGSQLIMSSILPRRSHASNETIALINKFRNQLERFKLPVCFLRSDNEFRTHKLERFCSENGIVQEFTAPGHSYQNGAAENANGWLVRKVQKLLFDAGLPKRFWTMGLKHAVFLHNIQVNKGSSAYERFHRREYNSDPNKLIPFGSTVFVRKNNNIQKISKSLKAFARTADFSVDGMIYFPYSHRSKGMHIFEDDTPDPYVGTVYSGGYSGVFSDGSSGFVNSDSAVSGPDTADDGSSLDNDVEMAFVPAAPGPSPDLNPSGAALIVPNDAFMEVDHLGLPSPVQESAVGIPNDTASKVLELVLLQLLKILLKILFLTNRELVVYEKHPPANVNDPQSLPPPVRRLFGNNDETTLHDVHNGKYEIAINFKEMLESDQAFKWLEAMEKENFSLILNDVYDLVKREDVPAGAKIIPGRYLCNVKIDPEKHEVFKVRMVAKGYLQYLGESYLDKFAPVSSFDSLRFLLAYAAMNNFPVTQVDFKTAFLNGKLKIPVYFSPPEGSGTDTPECVWKLNHSLYGTAFTSKALYEEFSAALLEFGFEVSKIDPWLFFKESCLFLIYVDD